MRGAVWALLPLRIAWPVHAGSDDAIELKPRVSWAYFWYAHRMTDTSRLSPSEVEQARKRLLVAMHLQEMEGNPLTPDEVAMFEMFERDAWPHERRRHIF
jgi:hypothetical protein